MKILIYGAGVIGSIFAAKLSLSGQDITVLARGKRLQEIRDAGIVLRSPETRKEEVVRVKTIESFPPGEKYDYILLAMQRTQVDAVLEHLSQNSTENIVFIVNTAAGYDEWKNAVGAERLLIGFPSAGGERNDGVVSYFIGRGLVRMFQTTTFGEISGERTGRVDDLIEIFNLAGIPSVFCSDMDAWQKTHVSLVTCIANALYGHDCDNRKLAASWSDVEEMVLGIKEGFIVLRKLGIRPTPRKLIFFRLPTCVLTAFFKIIMGTKIAEITMAKHCMVAKTEMIALQGEFDQLIEKSGVKTPHIDLLRSNLAKPTPGEKASHK